MAIEGRDRYENLSHAGGPRPGAPVRFGDFVVPAAVAWEVRPVGGSPGVRAEYEMRKGVPACLSLVITATPNGRAITTADLESLPGLERKALDAFKALGSRVFDDEDWTEGRNLHRALDVHTPGAGLGPALQQRPDDELAQVAEIYRRNIHGHPTRAVELALNLSRRTADRRIRAARDRGFLPPTTKGRKNA